jgi:hypothetical protein
MTAILSVGRDQRRRAGYLASRRERAVGLKAAVNCDGRFTKVHES